MPITQKEMNLILQLRNSVKNNSEIKKLEKNIRSLHKSMDKANSAFKAKRATSELQNLKKEIDKVTKSFVSLAKGKAVDFSQIKKSVAVALAEINKLVEASRRGKGELGKLARDNLGDFKVLATSLGGLSDLLDLLSKDSEKASSSAKNLSSANKLVTISLDKEIKTANAVSASIERLTNSAFNYSAAGKFLISVTNNLEKSLLKVQALGKLRGESIFEQNIRSTKVFLDELEKLRVKFAEISGEKVISRSTVTKEMALDFRKLNLEMDKAVANASELKGALRRFESVHDSFSRIQGGLEGFVRTGKKAGEAIKGVDMSLESLSKGSRSRIRLTEESAKKLETLIEKYKGAKIALKDMIHSMGGDVAKGAYSFKVLEKAVDSTLKGITKDLEHNGISAKKMEQAYSDAIHKMESNLRHFSEINFKTWSLSADSMRGARVVLEKANDSVSKLTRAYEVFTQAERLATEGTISLKTAQEAANQVIERANVVLETLGEKHHKNVIAARNLAVQFLSNMKVVDYIKNSMRELTGALTNVAEKQKTLATASKYLSHSTVYLRKEVELAARTCELLDNEILDLSRRLNQLNTRTAQGAASFKLITAQLDILGRKSLQAGKDLSTLNHRLMQAEQRVGDASRAMGRMSSEGFANMIISQAAWMAGFQIIFGTLDRFKAALSSVVENQRAVARAMRTARDDTLSSKEIIDKYTEAVNEMRASVGASAEETGEALYQLGSAGLNVRKSLAALSSTMDNIIGTEADMEQITNLVAGVYNNFGDQIVKVDGRLTTISNTFDEYNKKIVTSATLTEKFRHINDLLVRTFDAHQAEMDQIRDGLKFMAQSARRANLSLTEQLGILATLHDHLIKAGAAGRGMRVVISRISKDAEAFKKAFSLDIDLSAPLNMIDIFRQLHERIEGTTLSTEALGEYFKRLGLRGVEPLLVLIRYFDELQDNIKDLEDSSYGVSKAMREVRLDNLGDQARVANEKLNVLIIKGLGPLERVLTNVTGLLNYFGQMIGKTTSLLGGLVEGTFKIAGVIGILALFTFGLRNLGNVAKWVRDVFRHLFLQMKGFGKVAAESGKSAKAAARGTAAVGDAAAVASAKVGLLGNALKFVKYVSGTIVWIAAIEGLSRLIEYVENYRLGLEKEIESLKKESMQIQLNIQNFRDLKIKIADTVKTSENWKKIISEIGRNLNMNIGTYESQEKALIAINDAINHRIDLQKELAQINVEKSVSAEIKRTTSDLIDAKRAMEDLTFTNWNLTASLLRGEIEFAKYGEIIRRTVVGEQKYLIEYLGEASKQILTLNDRLASLREAFGNTQSEVARKKILGLIEVVVKQRNAFEELRKSYKERLSNLKLSSQAAEEAKATIEKLNTVLGVEKIVTKEAAEEVLKLAKKWEAANAQNRFAIVELGEAFRYLVSSLDEADSSFYRFEKNFEDLNRQARLGSIRKEIDLLTDDLFDLGKKGPKEFYRIIKASAKLAKDGARYIYQYRKETHETEMQIKSLIETIRQAEFDTMNNEIVDSTDKLASLKRQFGIAGQKIRKFEKDTSSASGGMKMTTDVMNQFGVATSMTVSSIDAATKSSEKNKKTTMKQKAIQKEMLTVYSESINKIKDARKGYEEYIKEKDKEIKANGETKKGLEESLELYDKQKEAIDARKTKLGEELEKVKERIALEKEMRKISSTEKRKRELDAEKNYQTQLADLAKERKKIEEGRIKTIKDIRIAEAAEVAQRLVQIKDIEAAVESLKMAARNIEMDITAPPDLQLKVREVQDELQFLMDMSPVSQGVILDVEGVEEHIAWLQTELLNKKFVIDIYYEEDKVRGMIYKLNDLLKTRVRKEIDDSELRKAVDKAEDLNKELREPIEKKVDVYVKYPNGKKGLYFGGEVGRAIGGAIPARVTKGEGFFPPNLVRNHRNVLNTLNSGRTVSRVPGSVAAFDGPGGVDNIHTFLPAGSYVLSKRGMEAYEASVRKGAQTFQEGGEVSDTPIMQEESALGSGSIGSFTIVVEKEGEKKNFPVSGKVSVLKGLRDELEEERLTRLH